MTFKPLIILTLVSSLVSSVISQAAPEHAATPLMPAIAPSSQADQTNSTAGQNSETALLPHMNNDNPSLPMVNGSLPPSITGMISTNHFVDIKAQDSSQQMSKTIGLHSNAASPAQSQAHRLFPDIRLAFDKVVADLMQENSAARAGEQGLSGTGTVDENPIVRGHTGSIQGTRTSKGLVAQKIPAAASSTAQAGNKAAKQPVAQSKALAVAPTATVSATTAALVQVTGSPIQSTALVVLHRRDIKATPDSRAISDLHATRTASIAMATSTSTPRLSQSPALIIESLDLVSAVKAMQMGQKKNMSDAHSLMVGTNDSFQMQARSCAVLLIVLGALILI